MAIRSAVQLHDLPLSELREWLAQRWYRAGDLLVPKSVTADEIEDGTISNRLLADDSVNERTWGLDTHTGVATGSNAAFTGTQLLNLTASVTDTSGIVSLGSDRLTVPADGVYAINAFCTFGGASGGVRRIVLRLNAVGLSGNIVWPNDGTTCLLSLTPTMRLAQGDFLDISATTTTSVTLSGTVELHYLRP